MKAKTLNFGAGIEAGTLFPKAEPIKDEKLLLEARKKFLQGRKTAEFNGISWKRDKQIALLAMKAGRQSALAEIDEGAKLGVERCRQNFLTMLDTAFQNGVTKERAEKQEQVRKLKELIKIQKEIHRTGQRLSDTDLDRFNHFTELLSLDIALEKDIDEIFPDCAEPSGKKEKKV